jgi:hypothetical protein
LCERTPEIPAILAFLPSKMAGGEPIDVHQAKRECFVRIDFTQLLPTVDFLLELLKNAFMKNCLDGSI